MQDKKNVLIVALSIDANASSGSKGRLALIKSLYQTGYQVTVLHYTRKPIDIPNINCIAIKEKKWHPLYAISRAGRLLNRWFGINISPLSHKFFGFGLDFFNDSTQIKAALKKIDPACFNMVWTLSNGNYYVPHKAVLQLPQWHSKWYAYVHDPFPQQLYPRPYNFVPYGYKQKRYFFRDITVAAKRMVFPSLMLKNWMQSYYSAIKGKSLIVPHQIPDYLVDNSIKFPDFFKPEKFNLLHAGNLLDLRDPKPLVKAYKLFLKQYPEAKAMASLIFLGKPSVFDTYFLKHKSSIPSLYVSKDYVPFKEVYAMQQASSVNIILEAKSEISPFLPGKFAHCVAADSPIVVVGPYYSECKRLLGQTYPYCFEFDEHEALAKSIGDLYSQWKTTKVNNNLNRPDLVAYLSKSHLEDTITQDLVC